MNKKKRKKGDVSIGIVVDLEGEILTDFTDDEETLEAPYIKQEDAEEKRRPS